MRAGGLVAIAVAGLLARPAAGQEERPLTLQQALAEARRGSPDGAVARARAEAARQAARRAGSYRWPNVALDGGVVRSTDPVAAFGGRLRQGRFTEADFDPAGLNRPDPLDDWSAGVGVVWRPLDRAAELGRRAARAEAQGAERTAAWTERSVAYATRVQYVQAVAAVRRAQAAEAALRAAEGNEARVALRAGEGVLTEADVLRARAAVEEARATVVDALRGVGDARERLAVTLGWPVGVTPLPTDTAFAEPTLGGGPSDVRVEGRPDLEASARMVAAAAARVSGASASRLPTLEGMARYGTHGREVLDGHRSNWTLGLQVSVPLFTGFAVEAGRAAAVAEHDAALRVHQRRLRQAAADVDEARRALDAARQRTAAADAAADAAAEAARRVRLRFEEGLATTSDLLSAEAQAAALRTASVNATLERHLAAARVAYLTERGTDR